MVKQEGRKGVKVILVALRIIIQARILVKSRWTLPVIPSPVRYAKFELIRCLIDIDILQNCLIDIDIDIFQNHHIDIDIDIFGIALSISISIFSNMTISILISISIFFKSVNILTINISNRYFNKENE